MNQSRGIDRFLVTAAQMQAIEQSVFAAGMPVAALMEKVGGLLFDRIGRDFPEARCIGLLVGPGHNGGDALVVGRELYLAGKTIKVWMPGERHKPLTAEHARYFQSLGAQWVDEYEHLSDCDLLIDGLFGFGLKRSLEGSWAAAVNWANQSGIAIASIDVPSGIETDSGATLGTAIGATKTYCLGLWKQGLVQDRALAAAGQIELVDFGLPLANIASELGEPPQWERITAKWVRDRLPLARWGRPNLPPNPDSHKYSHGHLLAICGSVRYSGAAILTALGTRSSGVGMVSLAVPESLELAIRERIPEALILPCPETHTGSIAAIPELEKGRYSAIAIGPGMDVDIDLLVARVCQLDIPLAIDADGLNALARLELEPLSQRKAATILTPHLGEFRRLFPNIPTKNRLQAAMEAAKRSGVTVLLKGARTVISTGDRGWVNPESTSALARGGTGDVLMGLIGGLLAQEIAPEAAAGIGAWWHAQAAIALAKRWGFGGVDPARLTGEFGAIAGKYFASFAGNR